MTTDSQINAIHAIGYSNSEGRFLRLVALHSGYFLRRQVLLALGCRPGKRSQEFIEELIRRRHASREVYRKDRHIFRLQSKIIYDALGQEDNRNRREHQPSTVRLRLMALDYVLEHPDHQYLVTPNEKLSYFFEERKIDPGAFPARIFRSNNFLTTRYFADGFPQFLNERDRHVVSFVYVDDN